MVTTKVRVMNRDNKRGVRTQRTRGGILKFTRERRKEESIEPSSSLEKNRVLADTLLSANESRERKAENDAALSISQDPEAVYGSQSTEENPNIERIKEHDFYFGQLADASYKFIIKEFTLVSETTDELMKLSKDEFESIIEDNQLNVKHEECVWDVLVKWVDVDPEIRKNDLVSLLPKVRFGLMDSKYFIDNVKDHRYIQNRADCRPYIIETLKFLYDLQLTSTDTKMMAPMLARPRYPVEVLFVIGGWSGGSPTSAIEAYDTKSDRWTRVTDEDPFGPRAYHGTIVMNHYIYVFGGFDGLEYFSSCRKFNTETGTWEEVAPMNSKRCYVSVVLLDGFIYAMGGFDGHHRLNSAEKYDFKRNQWTMIKPMNAQRSDACAAVLNGKIYITGGFNGQECMNTAECYSADADEWSGMPSMTSRRSGVSCVAYHGRLYVLGGYNGLARMNDGEKFDPATNRWSPVADMCNPRSNFGVEVLDDMIFVTGGFNGITTIASVECYNDRADEWFEAKNMQIFRSALSSCVVRNLPNVEYYMPEDRDKLSQDSPRNLERNSRVGRPVGRARGRQRVTIKFNNAYRIRICV
ncbi:Kelch repeat type 1,Kelch-type beta propeller,BTB-kelch protein,BTB/Kelch-associated [Cinara cedri]|uniref:Kelch repeat type 1,Kelch-type beta propeller,BTB-kelch protein,BTB/Kelch-associated n=1 Tax=Cinara cedri TaxID=506608 RepID=A0A5E4M6K8_9HEMI|nr:Kelch repeat type 1,Kelch-type beta propeller,BTB-kelch protein,BTB/Kelch-associated [Cinara cedri]